MIIKRVSRCWPVIVLSQLTAHRQRPHNMKKDEIKHGSTPRLRFLACYVIIPKQNNYKHCSVFIPYSIWAWSFYSLCNVPFQTNCQLFFLLLAIESGEVWFIIVMESWYAWLWTSNIKPFSENTRWIKKIIITLKTHVTYASDSSTGSLLSSFFPL